MGPYNHGIQPMLLCRFGFRPRLMPSVKCQKMKITCKTLVYCTIALVCIVLIAISFFDKYTIYCDVIHPFSPQRGTSHDTGVAFCLTIEELKKYDTTRDPISLQSWLLDQPHDGGIFLTVWIVSQEWFSDNPVLFEVFISSLDSNRFARFKERYIFILRDSGQSEDFKSAYTSSKDARIAAIVASL